MTLTLARKQRGTGVLLVMIVGVGVSLQFVCLNFSPSVPVGVYRLQHLPAALHRGMLVVLPVPASVRPFHGSIPLLKPIAAVSGDMVCVQAHRLWVQTEDYGPVFDTWHGEPLPQAVMAGSCAIVPPATVFLASAVDQSLDSRYFGPVAVATLTARAVPLLTW
jgi:type IV secretory pathway protease TraF